ncbi:MAG: helix-turn-helix domain-containing protein, partial [Mobilitalea sp.]
MQDIADNLGISKVSVSKVINNQPGIGDKMRQQILEKAQELGYVKAPRISSIGK